MAFHWCYGIPSIIGYFVSYDKSTSQWDQSTSLWNQSTFYSPFTSSLHKALCMTLSFPKVFALIYINWASFRTNAPWPLVGLRSPTGYSIVVYVDHLSVSPLWPALITYRFLPFALALVLEIQEKERESWSLHFQKLRGFVVTIYLK